MRQTFYKQVPRTIELSRVVLRYSLVNTTIVELRLPTTGGSIITSKVNLDKKCNHNNNNCIIMFSTFNLVVSPILRSADEVGPVEHPSLGWPSFSGI
jgi:hypothetical protein